MKIKYKNYAYIHVVVILYSRNYHTYTKAYAYTPFTCRLFNFRLPTMLYICSRITCHRTSRLTRSATHIMPHIIISTQVLTPKSHTHPSQHLRLCCAHSHTDYIFHTHILLRHLRIINYIKSCMVLCRGSTADMIMFGRHEL